MLDELLIERMFQPLCDVMRQRFGLTCCVAACFCLDAALIGWIMVRAPSLSEAMAAWAGATFPDLAILLLISRLMQRVSPHLGDAADVAMLVFAATALYLAACAERPPVRPWAVQASVQAG